VNYIAITIATETKARNQEARKIRDEFEAALASEQKCVQMSREALTEWLSKLSA
jgi:hypothetical protein